MCDFSLAIWEEAYAEGFAEAYAENFAEGKAEGARETSLKLSMMGLSENKIAEAVGFPVDTVSEWLHSQSEVIG